MSDVILKEKIVLFLHENNVSIYDLASLMDLNIDDYQEYLYSKMRDRSELIFGQIACHFKNKRWEGLQSSITEQKICSINDGDNNGRLKIKFICKSKQYILAYDLWDMLNNPTTHQDEIMLLLDDNGSVDVEIINLLSDIMEINFTDVNQDNLLALASTEDSQKLMESILDKINAFITEN